MKAILQVLQAGAHPMYYNEIWERIRDLKLRTDFGATPAATVNSNIAWDIKHHPDETPFVRVEPGVFSLRPVADRMAISIAPPEAATPVESVTARAA